ncbi:kinase [Gorillibacterium massiliense]|uniref:GHMP family kinase ATP-binding protein n=1 Tax=Gorillibacterium massiliense TaxID=1280390 RepID=UPI0004B6EC49|nr:kinase [Gorillibacterium massiliense]
MLTAERLTGKGSSFGTFGELLQGVLEDGTDFLVTFPIECYANALFIVDAEDEDLTVFPPYKKKSRQLASYILQHYALPIRGRLVLDGQLPIGKGFASSSADLVSTARAIANCYGLTFSDSLLEYWMGRIEPTDGVMYPGAVSFYHRRVQLREYLGDLPSLTVVALDEGGEVDTVEFNKIRKPFDSSEKKEYRELLNRLTAAIKLRDMHVIGEVATRSSIMNQKLRPKEHLDAVLALSRKISGLGVAVAHSGTCLGILLSNDSPNYQKQLIQACDGLYDIGGNVGVFQSWKSKAGKERGYHGIF